MGLAGVVMGHLKAWDRGYSPAGMGVSTISATDPSVPVYAAAYQLCLVKCPI